MKVRARKKFFKDLGKIKSPELLDDVQFLYNLAKTRRQPDDIPGFKWLKGYTTYARISIEDYRIGIQVREKRLSLFAFCIEK